MAILNIGSQETWVREVLCHEPGSNFFLYNDDFGDIKFHKPQYYLEAKMELLDGPEEWFYDMETNILQLVMPEDEANSCPDTDASADILRGRTFDNVLNVTDSSDVTIANITFFASNIIVDDNDNNAITFDSLIFSFPSSSHRMLKSEAEPIHTIFRGDDHVIINCTFIGGEGPALHYEGVSNYYVHNNEFALNGWVGQGEKTATVMDRHTDYGEFSQNTLSYNGISPGLRYTGRGSNITMNHMEGQCWGMLQQDGALIQVSPGAQNNVHISYNWVHDSPKKGIRFDGSGGDGENDNGYIFYNVAWNIEGNQEIYAKGHNHTVANNVGWDDNDQEDCTICVPTELNGNAMNWDSVVINNGASKFQGGGGIIENNYEGQDIKEQMVDPDNSDYRPVQGGGFITPDGGEIIGAYTTGEGVKRYWIPGRKLYKASFPIPHDGAKVSSDRVDVICQTGYLADKHDFYFGDNFDEVNSAGRDDEAYQETLHDDKNIFALPTIKSDKEYFWRVDAHRGEYVYKGDVWSFKTK